MMPMVPLKFHDKIKLNYLKQYELDEIEDNKLMWILQLKYLEEKN